MNTVKYLCCACGKPGMVRKHSVCWECTQDYRVCWRCGKRDNKARMILDVAIALLTCAGNKPAEVWICKPCHAKPLGSSVNG